MVISNVLVAVAVAVAVGDELLICKYIEALELGDIALVRSFNEQL